MTGSSSPLPIADVLGSLESALTARKTDRDRLDGEIASLEAAVTALRPLAPGPSKSSTLTRRYHSATARTTRQHEPCVEPERERPSVPAPTPIATDPAAQYPEVRTRRARILAALPVSSDIRCAELARHLDLAQSHVQTDLEKLAAEGLAERVSWGRWRRAADEVVVFSGKDSLLPASSATRQPA